MDPWVMGQKYEAEAPEPPAGIGLSQTAHYIHFKAFAFLHQSAAEYRTNDALGFPPEAWDDGTLEALRRGCEQLLAYRGFTIDRPLVGLGVPLFYKLIGLFHFDHVSHVTQPAAGGALLDEMRLRHVVEGDEITLYNLVPGYLERRPPGPPCPYCGELLRSARAKQCRACGMDWHDPRNVTRLKTGEQD